MSEGAAAKAAPAGAPSIGDIKRVASIPFLKQLGASIGEHHITAFASGLAYGAVFALLPMIALLVLLLGVFGAVDLVFRAIDELRPVLPPDALTLVEDRLLETARTDSSGAFGVGAVVSAGVALWGASGAMRRVMEALNVVHGADETRPALKKFGTSFLLAIGAIVLIGTSMVVVVVGGGFAERVFAVIGLGESAAIAWTWLRWPLLLVLLWAGLAGLYRFAPAARQTGGLLTPGTIIATFGWVGFSALFSVYVGLAGNFSASWGAVAGIVVLLLYLQYVGIIILAGALIDVLLYDNERPVSRLRRLVGTPATRH